MFFKSVRKIPLVPMAIALGSTGAVLAMRAVGWLTPSELWAYDRLFRRIPETCAAPINLVVLTEADIQKYGYPVNGLVMSELIGKIQASQPAAIAFDIYRENPAEPGHALLLEQLTADNIIAIERTGGVAIPPPPGVKRFGAANIIDDLPSGRVRRALYALGRPVHPSLGLVTAAFYTNTPWQDLLERAEPFRLGPGDGPYHNADTGGYQFLLNWQACQFATYSFSNVIDDGIQLVPGQIVVIGQSAESVKDIIGSPFGLIPGAENHAHVIAQFLDLESGRATPIRFPQNGAIALGLALYSWAHVGSIWLLRQRHYLVVGAAVLLISAAFGGAAALAYFAAFEAHTIWLPVISALTILGFNLLVATYAIAYTRLRDYTRALEAAVAQQSARLWEERYLVELGKFTRTIFHDLRSPLSLIDGYAVLLGKNLNRDRFDRKTLQEDVAELRSAVRATFEIADTVSVALNLKPQQLAPASSQQTRKTIELGVSIVRTSHGEEMTDRVEYTGEIADALPVVRASQGEILRLVLNLIENAYNALFGCGEADPDFEGRVWLRAWEENAQLAIEVSDNGPGLPASLQAALNNRDLSQLELSLPKGSFGLYAVARILTDNAGTLAVKSSPEDGTIFQVLLPPPL